LKPENTLGFVSISARENSALVETTDREGFKNTPHYRNFVRLFEEFVRFAQDAQEFIRRGWNEYQREYRREQSDVGVEATAEDLVEAVGTGLANVAKAQLPLEQLKEKLGQIEAESRQTLSELSDSVADKPRVAKKIGRVQQTLEQRISGVQEGLSKLAQTAEENSHLHGLHVVLQDKVRGLQEQLAMGVEAMSLGLTAEVLAHEVGNIVDQLAARTRDVSRHLSKKRITDEHILSYVEYVRSTTNALRKQIGHLTPSLKFARSKRSRVVLREFCQDLAAYHEERWSEIPIRMRVEATTPGMELLVNRGKLTQVCDNLILNSEYWLREDIRLGRIETGQIMFRVAEPYLRVSDNGFGVDPQVEDSLFEAFVTCKRGGRGLGLFVASQLLDSEGCSIRLKKRRNQYGRLYQFEIDFSDCLEEGS
ncbi:MAG: ATP-binding protein, partial [bacterium]